MRSICFYHNDSDGRAAASIIHQKYPMCEFVEIQYGYDEEQFATDMRGQVFEDVFIVDFSFTPKIMEVLRLCTKRDFVWCDHHISAKEKMPGLWEDENVKGIRDIERSGCRLIWDYLHPKEDPPIHIIYAEDYDLWKFNYPQTHHFSEAMSNKDLGDWITLMHEPHKVVEYVEHGKILTIAKLERTEKSYKEGFASQIDGVDCWVVNTNHDFSYLGSYINEEKTWPVALMWYFANGRINVSLRSRIVNVAKIAEKRGGGGHKAAAGFQCDWYEILNLPVIQHGKEE